MREPRSQERRRQILEAALRVFERHGFHGASVKEIAEAADVKSPALIYWYFKNKEELFYSVMIELSPLLDAAPELMAVMERPPDEALPEFARIYLHTLTDPMALRLLRLFVSEAARSPRLAEAFASGIIVGVLQSLTTYLAQQAELKRLRPHDSASSAYAFLTALMMFALGHSIFPPFAAHVPDGDAYARELSRVFVTGLTAV